MPDIQLGVIESRFADMIWEHEPVTSTELVKLAEKEFSWKRTTTHTVIKRLCEKGLFENSPFFCGYRPKVYVSPAFKVDVFAIGAPGLL